MIIRVKGGPGSGHRGHRGRPGKRGGSLPGKGGGGGGYTGGRLRWNPKLGNEATYRPNGDIEVGPKFFDLDKDSQAVVLTHEMCHGILDRSGATSGDEFWKTGDVLKVRDVESEKAQSAGIYTEYYGGNFSIEEAAADALTSRAIDASKLKRQHPDVYDWASRQYSAVGVDSDTMMRQARDLATRIERGPEGGLLTLEKL